MQREVDLGLTKSLGMSSTVVGGAQKRLKNDLLKCSDRFHYQVYVCSHIQWFSNHTEPEPSTRRELPGIPLS